MKRGPTLLEGTQLTWLTLEDIQWWVDNLSDKPAMPQEPKETRNTLPCLQISSWNPCRLLTWRFRPYLEAQCPWETRTSVLFVDFMKGHPSQHKWKKGGTHHSHVHTKHGGAGILAEPSFALILGGCSKFLCLNIKKGFHESFADSSLCAFHLSLSHSLSLFIAFPFLILSIVLPRFIVGKRENRKAERNGLPSPRARIDKS